MFLIILSILNFSFTILIFLLVFSPIINNLFRLFLNKKNLFKQLSDSTRLRLIKQLKDAVQELTEKKIGALITIENKDNLDKLRTDGIIIDAKVSSSLLISLFQKNSPLHDGAVIIRSDRIVYAATYYKITKKSFTNSFGARHRAALGISEISDATTVVVSEDKGTILLSKKNKIEFVNLSNFQQKLLEYLFKD